MDADTRIREQTHTVGIEAKNCGLMKRALMEVDISMIVPSIVFWVKTVLNVKKGRNGFSLTVIQIRQWSYIESLSLRDYSSVQIGQNLEYQLRSEQEDAVNKNDSVCPKI